MEYGAVHFALQRGEGKMLRGINIAGAFYCDELRDMYVKLSEFSYIWWWL